MGADKGKSADPKTQNEEGSQKSTNIPKNSNNKLHLLKQPW